MEQRKPTVINSPIFFIFYFRKSIINSRERVVVQTDPVSSVPACQHQKAKSTGGPRCILPLPSFFRLPPSSVIKVPVCPDNYPRQRSPCPCALPSPAALLISLPADLGTVLSHRRTSVAGRDVGEPLRVRDKEVLLPVTARIDSVPL